MCLGYGVDALEKGCLLVLVTSIPKNEYSHFKDHLYDEFVGSSSSSKKNADAEQKERKGHVRIDCKYTGYLIRPIGKDKTLLKIVTNINPKLKMIPTFLQNYAMKKASYLVIDTIRQYCSNVQKIAEYKERINVKNKEVYEDILRKVESYAARIENQSNLDTK